MKGAIYYEAMATVIFSHVKISEVFARKLSWYFIGVYIIKCNIFPNINDNIKYDMIITNTCRFHDILEFTGNRGFRNLWREEKKTTIHSMLDELMDGKHVLNI